MVLRASLRPLTVAAVAGALALGAAGCGGSSSTTTSASTTPDTTAATTPATEATPTTVADETPVSGPVPAVTGGTDLTKEPTLAAGTGTPPTALTATDLVVGTGPAPVSTNTVKVQYVGALFDSGKVFDASWTDSGATSFPLSGVVPGFRDAILGMKVGGRREVVIPPALGYGAAGQPPTIPGNATLVFVIDLLGVS